VRNERTKTGLHVGDEEDEPIEAAQAAARWRRRLAIGRLRDYWRGIRTSRRLGMLVNAAREI